MDWKPLSRDELEKIIDSELADCSVELRAYFESVAFEPTKWRQSPYGDEGGGFWALASDRNRVLWYNDIEEGFNVFVFVVRGTIPDDEYGCNQDELKWALPALMGQQIPKADHPGPAPRSKLTNTEPVEPS
jgi:hypothetical protein